MCVCCGGVWRKSGCDRRRRRQLRSLRRRQALLDRPHRAKSLGITTYPKLCGIDAAADDDVRRGRGREARLHDAARLCQRARHRLGLLLAVAAHEDDRAGKDLVGGRPRIRGASRGGAVFARRHLSLFERANTTLAHRAASGQRGTGDSRLMHHQDGHETRCGRNEGVCWEFEEADACCACFVDAPREEGEGLLRVQREIPNWLARYHSTCAAAAGRGLRVCVRSAAKNKRETNTPRFRFFAQQLNRSLTKS